MSIWFRRCPCCQEKIAKISLLTRSAHYACGQQENYKCLHCPICHSQITKPQHLFMEYLYSWLLLILCFTLAKSFVALFALPPRLPSGLVVIPLILVCSFFFVYLYISIVPLRCFAEKNNDISSAKRDHILVEGVLEFDEHVRIDPLEKKISLHLFLSPAYYFLFIVLGALVVLTYRYFCANC